MTREEFRQLQPGDKVRIVSARVGDYWNPQGRMDHWMGQVMTVRMHLGDRVLMEEGKEEWGNGSGWTWYPPMIECMASDEFEPPNESDIGDFLGL